MDEFMRPTGSIYRRGQFQPPEVFNALNLYDLIAEVYDGTSVHSPFRYQFETPIAGVVDLDTGEPREAYGVQVLTNGELGADMLDVPPNAGFPPHVHPGHHLLICLRGTGTFTLDRTVYDVRPGDIYMVEGSVPHAVGAGEHGHTLVAIGAPPKPLDAGDRMTVVDWEGVPVEAPEELVENGRYVG